MSEENTENQRFIFDLVYQPLEIITEYKEEIVNGVKYNKLMKVDGMKPYPPAVVVLESCLLDMLKRRGEIEFLMVVTMYNEDKNNFTDTMHGVMANLKAFQESGLDPKLIGCIIIVDGIRPFSQTFRKPDQNPFFSNFFNEQMIKDWFNIEDTINGIPLGENQEIAHCFSANTNLGLEGYPDLQLVFCVKQKNKRKLNTHLWFFGGFCEMIQPKFVMLLDVGTKPFSTSLCALYDVMKVNPAIAGVCGEIAPMDPQIFNIIVSGQTVEYTFSHIFDKALESCFGYIGVLPGAFSAYRWDALDNGPLINFYFKTMTCPEMMNCYYSNIYLAEDRVLSLAIVSKPGTQYLLKFVHPAYAETDVPEKLFVLLSQRRRWINGSWFALIDTWLNFGKISKSHHTRWRRIWMTIEFLYYTATILVSWIMVGSFYLFSQLIFDNLFQQYQVPYLVFISVPEFIMSLYLSLILLVFMLGLGVKTSRVEGTYKFISITFSIYMLVGFLCLNYVTFQGASQLSWYNIFLLVSMIGSYAIGVGITKNTVKVLTRTIQLLVITPIYVNLFGIYSVCNIHDCSWGNRPEIMTEEELLKVEEFQHYRTKWVIIWIICNLMFVKLMQTLIAVDPSMMALTVFFTMAVILVVMRLAGCLYHYTTWFLDSKGGQKQYIHLSNAAEAAKENKQLLEELASTVNKSRMISDKKSLRDTMLNAIGIKRGTSFHQNLTKMIKRTAMLDPNEEDEDEYEDDSDVSEPCEGDILRGIQNETVGRSMRRPRRGDTIIAGNKSVMNRRKVTKRQNTMKGTINNRSDEEIEAESDLENKKKRSLKGDLDGVMDFNPKRDVREEFKGRGNLEKQIEGVLNFEGSDNEGISFADSEKQVFDFNNSQNLPQDFGSSVEQSEVNESEYDNSVQEKLEFDVPAQHIAEFKNIEANNIDYDAYFRGNLGSEKDNFHKPKGKLGINTEKTEKKIETADSSPVRAEKKVDTVKAPQKASAFVQEDKFAQGVYNWNNNAPKAGRGLDDKRNKQGFEKGLADEEVSQDGVIEEELGYDKKINGRSGKYPNNTEIAESYKKNELKGLKVQMDERAIDKSIGNNYIFDEPEIESQNSSKVDDKTIDSAEEQRYLDMLPEIIHSISDFGDED